MELNLLAISIGLGLVISLLFSELFGLAAGGLVVPGYIALHLTSPIDVGATLTAALLTFFLVRIAATFVIVYGRRRTALMILVGYATGALVNAVLASALESAVEPVIPADEALEIATASSEAIEAGIIGYIVPGLIAIWLDRQGVLPTLAALLTSAVVVRLVLILVVPEEVLWYQATPDALTVVEALTER